MESSWRPLITDPALQERLRGVIREITSAVQAWGGDRRVDELTDHALLRAYLAQDGTVEDPDDVATAALESAIVQYAEGVASPALYGGGARIGWTVAHLAGGEDADEVCGAIEEALIAALDRWDGDYDLIGGLVGFGVYAIERLESPRGAELAARVLDALERRASPQPGGLGWHTDPRLLPDWQREIAPDGYLNLGLAHGIPGVIALLARYVARGVEVTRATALLDGAVGFLLASSPPPASPEMGRFPGWLPDRGRRSERIAWCYGDLGIAVAMWSAAASTGNPEWKREALAIAHGAAARDTERSGTVDTGICHGASGNAHLFNRLHQATGDATLGAAALRWFDRTIAMRRSDPIAGFPMGWIEKEAIQWRPDASMLTGAPGVALALHAAISDVEPAWDRLLLADLA
jgi:lantibiotic biosynthesis protein